MHFWWIPTAYVFFVEKQKKYQDIVVDKKKSTYQELWIPEFVFVEN